MNGFRRRIGTQRIACARSICLALSLLCATACSDQLSGTYGDEQGVTTYEFNRDGRTHITVLGANISAEYTIDGDKILVTSPQGTIVLTRKGDQLLGPMGMQLHLLPE